MNLKERIEELFSTENEKLPRNECKELFRSLRTALNSGEARAATPTKEGDWEVQNWVKKGILLGFRSGEMSDQSIDSNFRFFDKDTLPLRSFSESDKIRCVPGGSSIRDGAYVGRNTIMMPPSYINIGAYVGEGSLVDSHALVGSCAQVGKNVHLSAAAQLGGVLEPINASPVIIEDDVLVGGCVGVFEGARVKKGAVLGAGVILTRSTPVYDLVKDQVIKADEYGILNIPEKAVVVPGTRKITKGRGEEWGLSLNTPVIIKYRDEKTDQGARLEELLR
jgi:2,3,4,5-tetrahydropyridine-2-carboxylate N-succinyltransferase